MVAAVARGEREPLLNIGQVLDRLRTEFEDVSIPKIRFLESEGLIKPERTPSGYRKFSEGDITRLRYILRMQRDHYLPLKVIGEHLDAMDRGLQPPEPEPVVPTVPKVAVGSDGLPAPESFRRTDKPAALAQGDSSRWPRSTPTCSPRLEEFALITPSATGHYDTDALVIAQTASETRRLRHRAAPPARLPHRRRPRGRPHPAGRRPAPGPRRRRLGPRRGGRERDRRPLRAAARHLGEGRSP
ncbi:MerR family transcriptional regulator [Nocardioides convexus]|uniref:transcriptional regulator FtsR n=1 Tax=Nocardioides convexus TaxID=2712224 RepID=UPI0031010EEE